MKNEILYLTCKNVFNYNDSDCLRLGTENLTTSLQVNNSIIWKQ